MSRALPKIADPQGNHTAGEKGEQVSPDCTQLRRGAKR
jgi:hypothetical protein